MDNGSIRLSSIVLAWFDMGIKFEQYESSQIFIEKIKQLIIQ